MIGPVVLAYAEHMLVPCLRSDDIVVMDNFPTHKVAGIREAIQGLLLDQPRDPCPVFRG
jgi:hypothetical protein